ncbi:hypothetical protein C8R45DRAFT_1115087 [Mycena sanguinolenta]|nr:hypothetical protein C8R45DRAFT_1115087 [Mycena sanguinolenta]
MKQGKWEKWELSPFKNTLAWVYRGIKQQTDSSEIWYDRERNRSLHFGEYVDFHPGTLKSDVFGAPVPQYAFIFLSNGGGRPKDASTWMYPSKQPAKSHVNLRPSTPDPTELPMRPSRPPAQQKFTAVDDQTDEDDIYGYPIQKPLIQETPSNVVVVNIVSTMTASDFRSRVSDDASVMNAPHLARPIAIVAERNRFWLSFASITDALHAFGYLGRLDNVDSDLTLSFAQYCDFEEAFRNSEDHSVDNTPIDSMPTPAGDRDQSRTARPSTPSVTPQSISSPSIQLPGRHSNHHDRSASYGEERTAFVGPGGRQDEPYERISWEMLEVEAGEALDTETGLEEIFQLLLELDTIESILRELQELEIGEVDTETGAEQIWITLEAGQTIKMEILRKLQEPGVGKTLNIETGAEEILTTDTETSTEEIYKIQLTQLEAGYRENLDRILGPRLDLDDPGETMTQSGGGPAATGMVVQDKVCPSEILPGSSPCNSQQDAFAENNMRRPTCSIPPPSGSNNANPGLHTDSHNSHRGIFPQHDGHASAPRRLPTPVGTSAPVMLDSRAEWRSSRESDPEREREQPRDLGGASSIDLPSILTNEVQLVASSQKVMTSTCSSEISVGHQDSIAGKWPQQTTENDTSPDTPMVAVPADPESFQDLIPEFVDTRASKVPEYMADTGVGTAASGFDAKLPGPVGPTENGPQNVGDEALCLDTSMPLVPADVELLSACAAAPASFTDQSLDVVIPPISQVHESVTENMEHGRDEDDTGVKVTDASSSSGESGDRDNTFLAAQTGSVPSPDKNDASPHLSVPATVSALATAGSEPVSMSVEASGLQLQDRDTDLEQDRQHAPVDPHIKSRVIFDSSPIVEEARAEENWATSSLPADRQLLPEENELNGLSTLHVVTEIAAMPSVPLAGEEQAVQEAVIRLTSRMEKLALGLAANFQRPVEEMQYLLVNSEIDNVFDTLGSHIPAPHVPFSAISVPATTLTNPQRPRPSGMSQAALRNHTELRSEVAKGIAGLLRM